MPSSKINHAIALANEFKKQADAIDYLHGALDLVGLIPGLGEPFDGANAALYAFQGHYLLATLSLISAVPEIGDTIGKGAKLAMWVKKNAGFLKSANPKVIRAMRGLLRLAEAALTDNHAKIESMLEEIAAGKKYSALKEYAPYLKGALNEVNGLLQGAESNLPDDVS